MNRRLKDIEVFRDRIRIWNGCEILMYRDDRIHKTQPSPLVPPSSLFMRTKTIGGSSARDRYATYSSPSHSSLECYDRKEEGGIDLLSSIAYSVMRQEIA